MSHDPEAEDAMAKALHEVACPCGGWPCQWEANPDDPTDEAAEVSMARYRRDAPRMLRHLAAAGYTVTRDRYEGAGTERGKPWWICANGNVTQAGDQPRGDWRRLYRKIEGSTDGADRD